MTKKKTPQSRKPSPKTKLVVEPIPVFSAEPEEKPRYYVINDVLVGQTKDGEIRLPLHVPFRLIGLIEDLSPREQLYIVLRDRGEPNWFRRMIGWRKGKRLVQAIENLDAVDSWEVVRKFWQAFGEKEQARVGESLRSVEVSTSSAER
ncbi:MAG: hypothetical protein U1E32_05290 [Rhodoglobus sp.]|nr:hypothetical protein [Rhodoglobus sp.]